MRGNWSRGILLPFFAGSRAPSPIHQPLNLPFFARMAHPERIFLFPFFAVDKFPSRVIAALLSDQHILVLATEVIAQGPIIYLQIAALLEVVEVTELLIA